MNNPLEIPEPIRRAAATVELFFKVHGINEWALMGIQSRNDCREQLEQAEKQILMDTECIERIRTPEHWRLKAEKGNGAGESIYEGSNLVAAWQGDCSSFEMDHIVNKHNESIAAERRDDTGKVLLTKEQWEEAQRDTARLDWLAANAVFAGSDTPTLELVVPAKLGHSGDLPTFVRAAIDATRADTKGTSA